MSLLVAVAVLSFSDWAATVSPVRPPTVAPARVRCVPPASRQGGIQAPARVRCVPTTSRLGGNQRLRQPLRLGHGIGYPKSQAVAEQPVVSQAVTEQGLIKVLRSLVRKTASHTISAC